MKNKVTSKRKPALKRGNMQVAVTRRPRTIDMVLVMDAKGAPYLTVIPDKKEPECFVMVTATKPDTVLIANRSQLQSVGEALVELSDPTSFTARERNLLEAAIDGAINGAFQLASYKMKRLFSVNGEERGRIARKVIREMEKARYDDHARRSAVST